MILGSTRVWSQAYDIMSFDPSAKGPWSDIAKTSLIVPKVPNGSIKLDANPSPAEYGGFAGVEVTPGVNAWILGFPDDRSWNGPADSSFTYWLAHDDDYFYVGVDVKDDVVNSDDTNSNFWKDDSIEIVIDALNDRLDTNTDSSNDKYGGHCYANFQGRFSRWDDDTATINGQSWSSAVEWKYGPKDDIYGVGTNVPGGWKLEIRFKKSLFEDPAASNKLDHGYAMGFNIGLDDDDKRGPGVNGDGSRSQDLELQYFWANRQRHKGLTAEVWASLTPDQQKDTNYLAETYPLTIDGDGRLTHGGAGQIVFADAAAPSSPTFSIGLNFGADEVTNSSSASLLATDKAGVASVAQVNWNNLKGAKGTNAPVVADVKGTAAPTSMTVTWASSGTWSSTGRGEENNKFTGADKALMTGYLDTGDATLTTVKLLGVPAELSASGYDVYVYAMGGVGGRGGSYRIKDATTGTVLRDYIRGKSPTNTTDYVEVPTNLGATGNGANTLVFGVGNYMVFRGLKASDITVEALTAAPSTGNGVGSPPRAPINAIQLVAPGSGSGLDDVTLPGDPIAVTSPTSRSPAAEQVSNAIDNNALTKFLDFNDANGDPPFVGPVGFTVRSAAGLSVVTGIALTSANDAPERDPASYKLEGSKDGTTWTSISEGPVAAFTKRFLRQEIKFANSAAYQWYRVTIPTVANSATANSMQVAEVELLGTVTVPTPRLIGKRDANGSLVLEWTGNGTLQAAPTVNGPWDDVPGAKSPYPLKPTAPAMFGRVIVK
jgi:hypothetical protein